MGKGSGRRPAQVKQLEFDESWGRTFGKKPQWSSTDKPTPQPPLNDDDLRGRLVDDSL